MRVVGINKLREKNAGDSEYTDIDDDEEEDDKASESEDDKNNNTVLNLVEKNVNKIDKNNNNDNFITNNAKLLIEKFNLLDVNNDYVEELHYNDLKKSNFPPATLVLVTSAVNPSNFTVTSCCLSFT